MQKVFMFGTTIVVQEIEIVEDATEFEYRHRLVIGTIASEWATFYFPAHLTLGNRTFVSVIDGRSTFPTCFEVISGLERI